MWASWLERPIARVDVPPEAPPTRRRPSPNVIARRSGRRCGSSSGSSTGTTAVAPGAQAGDQLGLGGGDRLERAEQLEVHRADVDDHADVGLGDRGQLGDLARRRASPSRAPAPRCRAGADEDRQRQADLGVEVLGGGDRPPVRPRAAPARMSFVEVLPVEPVTPTTLHVAELRAPGAGEPLQAARAGRRRDDHAPPASCRAPRPRARASSAPPTPRRRSASRGEARRRRRARRADRRTGRPRPTSRESMTARRGPRCVDRRGRHAAAPPAARGDAVRRPARARSASRATVDVVERHLAAARELLALLVALAGDHDHVAGRARARPRRAIARAAVDRSTVAGAGPAPATISATIASGSSERGLSEVTTTTSASRAAISPISGRLPRSRSPPAPNTHDHARPRRSQLARGAQHVLQRVRRVGVVDEHGEVLPLVDRLEAAGHAARRAGSASAIIASARRRARARRRPRRARWRR